MRRGLVDAPIAGPEPFRRPGPDLNRTPAMTHRRERPPLRAPAEHRCGRENRPADAPGWFRSEGRRGRERGAGPTPPRRPEPEKPASPAHRNRRSCVPARPRSAPRSDPQVRPSRSAPPRPRSQDRRSRRAGRRSRRPRRRARRSPRPPPPTRLEETHGQPFRPNGGEPAPSRERRRYSFGASAGSSSPDVSFGFCAGASGVSFGSGRAR